MAENCENNLNINKLQFEVCSLSKTGFEITGHASCILLLSEALGVAICKHVSFSIDS
jgi:hypothetical protein